MTISKDKPSSSVSEECAKLNSESRLEAEFQRCAVAWKHDTGHLSVEGEIASHEAYQSIISTGERAIPLILKDLMREPHYWFVALDELTGESPEFRGLEGDGRYEYGRIVVFMRRPRT